MARLKCDHIKRQITLTSAYITWVSLKINEISEKPFRWTLLLMTQNIKDMLLSSNVNQNS